MRPAKRPAQRPDVEPVRTPQSAGWLSPTEARALLAEMFGATVATRTIQAWARDTKRPLRHVRIGHRCLIHRDDLLARVMDDASAEASHARR
jgi:hypothetical protein